MRISDWSSDVCSFDLPCDIGLARGVGLWVEAVLAFGVLAVAGELVEGGAGPDVGRDAEVLVEQVGPGDHFAQDRARAHQLHAVFALLRLAGVLARTSVV